MLSYQHAYHAGNAADVHKHALLAWVLDYLTAKPKPIRYFETHAGRGLYDLSGPEAGKTGEAQAGVARFLGRFDPDHPYPRLLAQVRGAYGPDFYPGSPLIAALALRDDDRLDLAERHPGEHAELAGLFEGWDKPRVRVQFGDGLALARGWLPPEPRRGVMLVDPSYETEGEYAAVPAMLAQAARVWNVGVLMLWYPILREARHGGMMSALGRAFPQGLRLEARFAPARPGHGLVGSGVFVVNAPHGIDAEAARIAALLAG